MIFGERHAPSKLPLWLVNGIVGETAKKQVLAVVDFGAAKTLFRWMEFSSSGIAMTDLLHCYDP